MNFLFGINGFKIFNFKKFKLNIKTNKLDF